VAQNLRDFSQTAIFIAAPLPCLGQLQRETRIMQEKPEDREGKIKYALFGWLLGLPIPIIVILLFVRGCDF